MLVFIFLKKRVATAWYGKPVEISPAYEGRASLDVDPNTRVSTLHLTQLTMQENRHFQCNVLIYGDDDGTTGTTTSLVVLGENYQTDRLASYTPKYNLRNDVKSKLLFILTVFIL